MEELVQIWKNLRLHLLLLLFALTFGLIGYHFIYPEGYTDLFGMEKEPLALIFSMFLMLMGLGVVLYSISTITAYFVEGKIDKLFLLRKILRRIKKMENHYIICGAGQTGIHIIKEMHTLDIPFVVVDSSEDLINSVREDYKGVMAIKGDATIDETLEKTNIDKAKGIIVALSNDKDNLFLTLTARIKNPSLKIVSRSIDISMREKLITAGANYVVSPNFIGGMRMASEILRPNVVSFLDTMLRGTDKTMRISEYVIPSNSKQVGKSIAEINIHKNCGINLLATKRTNEDHFEYNPGPEKQLEKEMVLLYIGTPKNREKIEHLFS